jgi:oligopeptidase B
VLDLASKQYLEDTITGVKGDIVWHKTLRGFLYTPINAEQKTDSVKYHELGSKVDQDKVLYQEKNPVFWVGITETRSRDYVVVYSGTHSGE